MTKVLVLSARDVSRVFTVTDALAAVEDAYVQKARGTATAWPMTYAAFEPGVSDMDIRSGDLAGSGLFGLKLTAWFSRNPARGLPDIFGTTLLLDDRTGEPVALLNAAAITGLRTGAAAALGVRALGRPDTRCLLVVGMGHQCPYQVACTAAAVPAVERVLLWDPRCPEARHGRAAEVAEAVHGLLAQAGVDRPLAVEAVSDGAAATAAADAVVTVTPATEPVVRDAWVRPGTHVSAVGADMEGKQELEDALVARARVFVDDRAQSVATGELEVPVKDGVLAPDDVVAELGEVLAGMAEGRTSRDEVTVFDTSGIAVQDLAASKVAFDRAVEEGLGTWVEL